MRFLIYFFPRRMLKKFHYRVMDKGFRSWLLRRPLVPHIKTNNARRLPVGRLLSAAASGPEQPSLSENPVRSSCRPTPVRGKKEQWQGNSPAEPDPCQSQRAVRAESRRTEMNPGRIGSGSGQGSQSACGQVAPGKPVQGKAQGGSNLHPQDENPGRSQSGDNATAEKNERSRNDVRGIDCKTKNQGNRQKLRLTVPVRDQDHVRAHQDKSKDRAHPDPSPGGAQDTGEPSRLKEQDIDKFCVPKSVTHARHDPSGSPMRESKNW